MQLVVGCTEIYSILCTLCIRSLHCTAHRACTFSEVFHKDLLFNFIYTSELAQQLAQRALLSLDEFVTMMIQTILSIFNLLHHLRTFPSLVCLCTQILCSHLIFKSLKFIIIFIEHLLASLSSIIFNIIIMMLLLLYFIVDTHRDTHGCDVGPKPITYIVVARIKKGTSNKFFSR